VILGELVVVEIVERGIVVITDIDDGGGGSGEVGGRRFAADERHRVEREEDGAGEKLVFMSAAGVREDRGKSGHGGGMVGLAG
jgi:hypothetical protein